jgi:hypothetical protein
MMYEEHLKNKDKEGKNEIQLKKEGKIAAEG